MSDRSGFRTGCAEGRRDILSASEEEVLAELRDLLACLRVHCAAPDLDLLLQAVTSAGASVVGLGGGDGSIELMLRDVHFRLRLVPDGIQIGFP